MGQAVSLPAVWGRYVLPILFLRKVSSDVPVTHAEGTHTIPAFFSPQEWLCWARSAPCAVIHVSGVRVGTQEPLLETHWN